MKFIVTAGVTAIPVQRAHAEINQEPETIS
jgi:hypothetical protein